MAIATLVIEDASLCVPAGAFCLDGFRRWVHSPEFPEGRRASFLGGEVSVDLSREELFTHNFVKSAVTCDVGTHAARQDLGRVFASGALFVNEEARVATEPDAMLCLTESFKSGKVWMAELVEGSGQFFELRGSPDLIVEIVSDTSERKDKELLPRLYYAAGVKEYWLIDARAPKLDFRLHVRGRDGFVPVKPDAQGYRRSRVLRGAFRLTRKKSPLGAQYRLLAKA